MHQQDGVGGKAGCTLALLGDPVTDTIVHVPNAALQNLVSEPGGCSTVDGAGLQQLQEQLKNMVAAGSAGARSQVPGGSAANVSRCAAELAPKSLACRCAENEKAHLLHRHSCHQQLSMSTLLCCCCQHAVQHAQEP